jgi:quercetin dioxygenase-like cupin family protein
MEISTSYSYGVSKSARESIFDLQHMLEQDPDMLTPEEATERFVTHYFAPHTYARKMFIAKDTVVVGKIHNHAHLNILIYGKCKVVTEFGNEILEGPRIWTSEPGTKRAVYALTDLEWMTIHHNPTDTENTDELEEYIIAKDYESFNALRLESGEIS